MKKDFMQELKNKYKAWLVYVTEQHEDNGETHDTFLIFTENKILSLDHVLCNYTTYSKEELEAKEENFLEYYYPRLKRLLESKQLQEVQEERLSKILKELKIKYEDLQRCLRGTV